MLRVAENLIIIEFLLFSGGLMFDMTFPRTTMAILFFTCLYVFLKHNEKGLYSFNYNIKLSFFITLWVLFINIIVNDYVDNTFLHYIVYSFSCGVALSVFNFFDFRIRYLKYLNILCVLSILVQLSHDFLGISTSPYSVPGSTMTIGMNFVFFNTEWGDNRMASIFWEPGQCQVVLIFGLCLFYDELQNLSKFKKNIKKFGILIIAILMTSSTMGYLALGLLVISIAFTNNAIRKNKLYIPLFIIIAVGFSYLLITSSVVQNKFSGAGTSEESVSYKVRMADNLGLIELISARPITGFGVTSKEAEKLNMRNDNLTSSNGWLNDASKLGVPYVLFILLFMFKGANRMFFKKRFSLAVMLVLVLSQCNEYAPWYPYVWIYIFRFHDYQRNNVSYAE